MEVDINSLSRPGCVLLSGLQRARRQTHYTCESPDSLSHLFLSFALNVDLKNDCMLRVISSSKNRVYKGLWQTKPKHLSDKNFDLYFAEFYIFTLNVRPRKTQKFTQSNRAFHFVANNYNFLGRVGGWGSLEMWLNTEYNYKTIMPCVLLAHIFILHPHQVLRGGQGERHGHLPRVRFPELPAEHAAGHGGCWSCRRRSGGGHLVHRRRLWPDEAEVLPGLLPETCRWACQSRDAHPVHQGEGIKSVFPF